MYSCHEMESLSYLCHEHCSGGNLHVMAKLEILQECDSLCHTNVSIDLEAHVCNWVSRIDVSNDVLSDDVQPW